MARKNTSDRERERRTRLEALLGEIHRDVTPQLREDLLDEERSLYDDAGLPR